MATTTKATYTNGVFMPINPVDLEEGTEVTVSLWKRITPRRLDVLPTEVVYKSGDGWLVSE